MRGVWAATIAATVLAVALSVPAVAQSQRLERERLQLEIDRLNRESSWQSQAQRWLPAGSVLVAVVVASIGGARYLYERKREHTIRTEEGVAHNLERVVDAPSEASGSNARSITALRNLDALVRKASGNDAEEHRTRVTDALTAIVRDELSNFQTPQQARLPVVYLDNWASFRDATASDHDLCRDVALRYLDELAEIKSRRPMYVATVRREGGRYVQGEGSLAEADIPMFPALVAGFERYVAMLPSGAQRDATIRSFSEVAAQLGAQLYRA